MAIRYRIIQKDIVPSSFPHIVCDGMLQEVGLETLQMFKSTYPENIYEIEKYNWQPKRRYGRDPDLIR